ncbi:MAG: hypothetical protein V3T61_06335 [Acidobacteriota bacterium]
MSTPDYQILDRYLETVFSLIEGLADVEEAFTTCTITCNGTDSRDSIRN